MMNVGGIEDRAKENLSTIWLLTLKVASTPGGGIPSL